VNALLPVPAQGPPAGARAELTALHRRRLREVWRSAGWPCRDAVEVELLAAGLLMRHIDAAGRETLHLTEAGFGCLAGALAGNRARLDRHEALVGRVAREMQRAGRVVWRALSLRAPLPPAEAGEGRPRWALVMPDVFSIRHTTAEAHVEPIVHEVKVSRADLLSDLRRPDKGAAYAALCSQCWYVLRAGIGSADEVPEAFGVMFAGDDGLVVARPAPRRPLKLPFPVWMALARAAPEPPGEEGAQGLLAVEGGGTGP
jgi:hypothetical protein